MLSHITPVVITFNEQANIERTLRALSWAGEVLIVDSFSTDNTLELCGQFPNVRIVQRKFDNFAGQCNFALQQQIKTQWVLSMDADYVLSRELVKELDGLTINDGVAGFEVGFDYLINGYRLNGSLYPPRTVLYKKELAYYEQDGHAHKVNINGNIQRLKATIQHDDRKPFSRWLASQKKYARQESRKLAAGSWADFSWPDRARYLAVAPFIIVPYVLIAQKLLLNGWHGLLYAGQRFTAELYLQLARLKLLK